MHRAAAFLLGVLALVCGAYRFTGHKFHRWNIYALVGLIAVWVGALLLGSHSRYVSGLLLKALRAILFLWAGFMILRRIPAKSLEGRTLTSWSLICWGIHLLVFSVIHLPKLVDLAFGFLVGLQVLSALGMVVMVVDRMRLRAEDSESRVRRIEGLLPICSFCKRIRDENNSWHSMETYVREHSDTEFSHGLCPDCAKLHYSEYYEETEGKKP